MKLTSKEIQLQFDGFLQTPCLWTGNTIYELKTLNKSMHHPYFLPDIIFVKL